MEYITNDGIIVVDKTRWVRPDGPCRNKYDYPYSYDDFFIWGNATTIEGAE